MSGLSSGVWQFNTRPIGIFMQRAAKKMGGMFAKFSSVKAQWCGRTVGPGIIEGCSVAKCRFVKMNPAIDSCIAKISFALEYCFVESTGSVKY
ncbi:hypothetical protein [Planktomarina temperata]|uniref:hypothetical protein n=1 Tax=Planktomarina temperata TaxID=1284658 RepID=UPI003F6A49DD